MAANQALIRASRGTSEQFIDYGAALQPVVRGMMREMEIADNKMASFVNSLPPGANIEKLPQGMRPEVERYLRDSKNEYAEAAKVASKLNPSDPGYREAVDKMNSIKTGFMNLNKNLEAHLANRVEFIQDKDDLSGSLSGNDNIFLTSVYAGDYEGLKVTNGELEFLDKSTNEYKRNSEFPQYSLTDVVGADGVAKIFDNERNLGNKGLDWNPKRSGREVNRLFKKVGSQGVIDMAFDGFDEYDGNYIDTVVKQQLAPEMPMQEWLVSGQRDNLTTKEGFAPYKAGFQNFISDIVKDGYDEGNAAYNKRNTIAKPGSKQAGFEATNKAIDTLVAKDTVTINDLVSLTLPSDRKFKETENGFVVVDSNGYAIEGTSFKAGDKKAMRNALQFATNLPPQYRTTEEIKPFKSKFDFTAGLPSGEVDFTTKFIQD